MTTTLGNLPPEILQQVSFHLRFKFKDIQECILVCSSWRILFQELLYSSVELHHFSQSLKLVDTLKNNNQLSSLIQEISFALSFKIRYNNITEVETITTLFTLLPNLKCIDMSSKSGMMKYLLDALLAKQLPCINRLDPPFVEEELDHYIQCALLLKNRLENLSIVDFTLYEPRNSGDDEETILRRNRGSVLFHRLYDKLNEFTRVNGLRLATRSNNDINWLERVTECCPLLESLDMSLHPALEVNTGVQIQNIIPAPKVRHLAFGKIQLLNPLLTRYLASKFPSLKSLEIYEAMNQTVPLSKVDFEDFLAHLSRINRVDISSMPFDNRFFVDTIGPFWRTMTKTRTMSIELCYDEYEDSDAYEFSIDINDSHISHFIQYPGSTNDADFINILANYGECINSLIIDKQEGSLPWTNPCDSLVFQPLKYCLNLKELTIYGCPLIGSDNSTHGVARRETFDSLRFYSCTIESSAALENISKLYSCIKELKLYYSEFKIKNPSPINIHLRETNIGSLLFSTDLFLFKHRLNYTLLVKLTAGHIHGYYMLDSLMKLKSIDYQDFNCIFERGECLMFDLKFKSIKSITIQYFEKKFEIPL